MFDFAWSEIALIGVVALVLIGPKDMPVAIKAVAGMIRKARKMAGEFQAHVDEMSKDGSFAEVRQQIAEIRSTVTSVGAMDIGGQIARAVDGDGSLRAMVNDDPFATTPSTPAVPGSEAAPAEPAALPEHAVDALPVHQVSLAEPPVFVPPGSVETPAAEPAAQTAPAFIPPAFIPPAFVPPSVVREAAAHQPDAAGI